MAWSPPPTSARPPAPSAAGRPAAGGLLTVLAVGCPVCNKLVVLALGTSGAMSLWASLQPVLAVASVALLGWALRTRLAAERSCPLPARTAAPPPSGAGGAPASPEEPAG